MNCALIVFLVALDPLVFGPGGRFQLESSNDDFGLRSHGIIEKVAPGRIKFYPLPQSTAAAFARLRPEDARINPLTPGKYERQEVIGPYQVEGRRLWFGNSYYDSEGMRGVGAFGYFDTVTRGYTLFSPKQVAPYEISAIYVQPGTVWIALDRFVEDISKKPGGLIRWDRNTHAVQKYPLEFVVDSITPEGDGLRLKTREGYALFQNGALRRFLASGTPIQKFPPPPTHQ
jgi:hypothetical protein